MKALGIAILAVAIAFGAWTIGNSAVAKVKSSVAVHSAKVSA